MPKKRPNQGVQRTPLARLLGWARSTRQSATAYPNVESPNLHTLPATRIPGAPAVGRTHIAWQLPPAAVLPPSDARQRRS